MFVNSLFLAAIIALMFIDYQHQILPNNLTIPGAVAGILLSPLQLEMFYSDSLSFQLAASVSDARTSSLLPWAGSLIGALIGGGALLAVALPYQLVRKRQGLGVGDIKMMVMVGTFLGWRLALLTVFLGSALGLIVGIFLMLFRRGNLQTKLPFGTFLGAASMIALFYGLHLIRLYVGPTPGNP
jgi:leader peptidase (prepilin peptidase)/N-methyltransferase